MPACDYSSKAPDYQDTSYHKTFTIIHYEHTLVTNVRLPESIEERYKCVEYEHPVYLRKKVLIKPTLNTIAT